MKPILGYILIKADEVKKETESGILIPEVEQNEQFIPGTIKGAGKGNRSNGILVPLTVKMGDRVLFNKNATRINLEGIEYHVVIEANILGILN